MNAYAFVDDREHIFLDNAIWIFSAFSKEGSLQFRANFYGESRTGPVTVNTLYRWLYPDHIKETSDGGYKAGLIRRTDATEDLLC